MNKLNSIISLSGMGIQADAPRLEQLQLRLLNLDLVVSLFFSILLFFFILINFTSFPLLVGVTFSLVPIYIIALIASKKAIHNVARFISFFTPLILISFFHYYLGANCFFSILLLAVSLTTLIYCTMPKVITFSFFGLHLILFAVFSLSNNVGNLGLSAVWSALIFKINIVMAMVLFAYKAGMLRYLYFSLISESETSEFHYQKLFEDNLVGLVITNEAFNITKSNKAFQEMLGFTEKELEGKSLAYITAPAFLEDCRTKMMKMARGEMSECTMEKAYSKKDKALFYSQTFLRRFERQENGQSGYIISVLDMNEHIEAQNALRKSEEKYRDIFENVADGIAMLDKETNIIQANKAVYEIVGINPGEPIQVKDLIYKPDRKKSNKYFQKLLETGSYTGYQGRIYNPRKGVRYIEVNASGIFDADGNLVGSRDIIRDITEQKKQEATLRLKVKEVNEKNEELKKYIKSNMQLENFAYIASHDLKAPLRTIVSFSQLLKRSVQSKLSTSETEYLKFIISATQNMHLLVDDLLAYSKVNSSQKELQQFNFNHLLESLLAELHSAISEKQAKIHIDSQIECMIADKIKIRQILQNLIANAIKFHKPNEHPRVVIKAEEQETTWQFRVSDNGIGIKEAYFEKVFMLFRKLNAGSQYQGSGIGLAICKLIVEQHGGKIWIESVPNEGTTFYFTIRREDIVQKGENVQVQELVLVE